MELSKEQRDALSFLAHQYPAATTAASVAIVVLCLSTVPGEQGTDGLRGYELLRPLLDAGLVCTVSTDKKYYRITESGLEAIGWKTTSTPRTEWRG